MEKNNNIIGPRIILFLQVIVSLHLCNIFILYLKHFCRCNTNYFEISQVSHLIYRKIILREKQI